MILTHGANSLPRGGGGTTVTIGGREYPIVKIGNQLWMAENLDFKFDGLDVGNSESSSSQPRANYYNNNESAYGINGNKYGLLYNWPSVKYLEDNKATLFPPGWHVPSTVEWDALKEVVGAVDAGTKLKSTTGWSSGNGDDSYGFAVFPAGNQIAGSFDGLRSTAYFWTANKGGGFAYNRYFTTGALMNSDTNSMSRGYSVRLVKDA